MEWELEKHLERYHNCSPDQPALLFFNGMPRAEQEEEEEEESPPTISWVSQWYGIRKIRYLPVPYLLWSVTLIRFRFHCSLFLLVWYMRQVPGRYLPTYIFFFIQKTFLQYWHKLS